MSAKLLLSLLAACAAAIAVRAASLEIASPDGNILFHLSDDDHLTYRLTFRGAAVIEPSRLGLHLDGTHLGRGAKLGEPTHYTRQERYPILGVHAEATEHSHGATIPVTHPQTGIAYTLEVRVFNDGSAFRFSVPGGPTPRVPDAGTDFVLPMRTIVWYHGLDDHYEDLYEKKQVRRQGDSGDFPAPKGGEWAAVPMVVKLPEDAGYAYISEAALANYAGMALQVGVNGQFRERLGHSHPPSYPYVLRYSLDEADRLSQPAAIAGPIDTPWRVIAVGRDLNTLVNSDIVTNLAPPPDQTLFPRGAHTEWVRPGRALWRYLDGGDTSLAGQRAFADLAEQLGFEYNVLEGYWRRWSPEELRSLADYSKERGVGLILWRHSRDLRTPEARKEFWKICTDAGVAGAKIDFFDHEAKELIDLYQTLLREAAAHRLVLNFHGANKSTGEIRTWPNELTREGVYGLEHRGIPAWAELNATLPFTRFLVGPGDYTPVHFGDRRKETTWAHQLATAAVFTSPMMIYAAHPEQILANPAAEIVKTLPATWDETIVLPGSEIGECAVFARRRGDLWYVAVVNGTDARTLDVELSFLGDRPYRLLGFGDVDGEPAALGRIEKTVTRGDTLALPLSAAGGYIARLMP